MKEIKINQELLRKCLKSKGFRLSPNLATLPLVPHCYKDTNKNYVLITGIGCSMFTGINTKEENIGCICFFYTGTRKKKHSRQVTNAEILKVVRVYKSTMEVMDAFEEWRRLTIQTILTWHKIV